MIGVAALATLVREHRRPAAVDNPFLAMERDASRRVSEALDSLRKARDQLYEVTFKAVYG